MNAKTVFKRTPLLLCAILCLCLCACGDGPYGPYKGEWEFMLERDVIARMEIDFEQKVLTRYHTIYKVANEMQVYQWPILAIETREKKLGIATSMELYIFEPVGENGMLMKSANAESNNPEAQLARFMDGGQGEVFDLTRPKKENDSMLPKLEFARTKLGGNWYARDDRKNPVLKIDPKEWKVSLFAPKFYKNYGSAEAPVIYYYETLNIDPKFNRIPHAYFHFDRKFLGKRLSITTLTKPMELYYVPGTDGAMGPYFPEMSSSEWEAFIKAENEEKQKEKEKKLSAAWAERWKARDDVAAAKIKFENERKAKAERLATMTPFLFAGIGLKDTPVEVVKKALNDYFVSTSFAVSQSGNEIKQIDSSQLPVMDFMLDSPLLDKFFHFHEAEKRRFNCAAEFDFQLPKSVLNAGVRIDRVVLEEKERRGQGRTYIVARYFTLPGEQPEMLMLTVRGDIVPSAEEVFTERYGAPDATGTFRNRAKTDIWRSKNELVVMTIEDTLMPNHSADTLTIFSLDAYNKLYGFEKKILDQEQERKQQIKDREKEAQERRKSKI